ncbi:restriction endonuclease subunit S [Rhizobium indicum]|uniref:restriction endonuclease subunit S n=1 Tax=Rhizobium indicum TaxID=2583231 RepID=UPI001106F67E|nr:restriction endonuclease subunit S [Rhizobium indicum]QKK32325.1 restriction endonuclease subunit S [Rhizobium indicum]
MSDLPRGWVEATLGKVATKIGSGATPTGGEQAYQPSGVPLIRSLNVHFDGVREEGLAFLDDKQAEKLDNVIVQEDDVLLNITGASIGRVAVAPRAYSGARVNQHVSIIRLVKEVVPRYVRSFLASPSAQDFITRENYGATRQALTKAMIEEFAFPLPPLAEQKRIVGKLDALNAKSARTRTELARIETLVSRYKQAVLSKAFSGELRSREAAQANTADASIVRALGYPAHWRRMQLGEIADIKSGITLGKKRKPDEQLLELPYLRVANVQRGWLDLREMKTVEVTAKEAEALFLREGDVLMNEGGDRDKLGRGWVWDGQISNCIHQNHVFRVRLASETIPSRFLSYYANEFGQKHFFDEGKQTTNLASISKSKLSAMQVPIPPFEEAEEIVRHIESTFAKIDRLAAEARRALDLVCRLDEAILAKAFRGELVPQHEDDESAERLLARIVQDRAKVPRGSVKRRMRAPLEQSPPHPELSSTVQTAKGGPVAKSRLDEDVFEKPYLASLIKRDHISDVQALFTTSELPVADFYKQLAWEISTKHISDSADRLKAL